MLDIAGILFSSVMMMVVIVRAVVQDRRQPWFAAIKIKETPTTELGTKGRRRR